MVLSPAMSTKKAQPVKTALERDSIAVATPVRCEPAESRVAIRHFPGVKTGDARVAQKVRKSHAVSNDRFRSGLVC